MIAVQAPSQRYAFVDEGGFLTREGLDLLERLRLRTGEGHGYALNGLYAYETTISQSEVASGASKIIIEAISGHQWKPRWMWLSGGGTNFSGGSGDRLMSIGSGSTVYSIIPAATLQSLDFAVWGDTGLPKPSTAAHATTASAAGVNVVAKYSGGSADYTAGAMTLVIIAERVV